MNDIINRILAITPSQTLTVGFLISIIIFIFYVLKLSIDKQNKFHWIDLISDKEGNASLTRILQLTAGVTATWVIIQSALGKWLTAELFLIYLGAMGISEGYTKWVNAKYQTKPEDK